MYEKNIILAVVIVLALAVVAIFFFEKKNPLVPAVATQDTGISARDAQGGGAGTGSDGATPAVGETLTGAQDLPTKQPKTISLPSGLQYQDLKLGDGAVAKSGQTVSVNYIGVLTDGTKFDSSFDAGRPFSFGLGAGQVIKGWDEGVAGMKVGGRRILIIPATLGYGNQANGKIPANSTLIFQVDLLGIK